MTPTLPETLARLAERVPERVRIDPDVAAPGLDIACVYFAGHWHVTWELRPEGLHDFQDGLSSCLLRAALEEEIEARGWTCRQESRPGGSSSRHHAYVYLLARPLGEASYTPTHHGRADSPAHALALALLSALEAQRGEG